MNIFYLISNSDTVKFSEADINSLIKITTVINKKLLY